MLMTKLNQIGDTIVEVLIAIAIISLVLTGAFMSAQQSLTGNRKSQERVEALKVAEEQLELLRQLASVPGNAFTDPAQSSYTCITNTGAWQGVPGMLSPENFSDAGYHPPACTRSPAAGVAYYPVIVRSGSPGAYNFKIFVRWDRAGGGGIDEATLAYRLYS
jgi:type II secretory pathway pseudopilin PulG